MNKHSRKIVWLAAALLALSATAADAGQRQGAQAQSRMHSQQPSSAATQQQRIRQQQQLHQQNQLQTQSQLQSRSRDRIHAVEPAGQGQKGAQGAQTRRGQGSVDGDG